MGRRLTQGLLALTCAGGISAVANAELTYGVDAGLGHSDNVTRVDEDEVSQDLGTLGVTLEWHEERPRLLADVSADANYVHYLDDAYEDDVVGSLNGSLDFAIRPERFHWLVQDTFGQQASDPFSPDTPDTHENVNVFSTGPQLRVDFGLTRLALFAQYSMTEYERSNFDGDRTLAGLSLGRAATRGDGLALNLVTEQISFDEDAFTDYDRESAYLSYGIEGARTEINAELGYSWLEEEGGTRTGDPRMSLNIRREMSSSSRLSFSAGRQLTDSSDALRASLEGGATGGTTGISSSAAPFENRSLALSWEFNRQRTSLGLGMNWSDDTYESQPLLDRERMSWTASVERALSSNLTLSLEAALVDEEFENASANSDQLDLSFSGEWALGRTLGLRLTVSRSDRDTDLAGGEYVENRVFLGVHMYGGERRQGGRAR